MLSTIRYIRGQLRALVQVGNDCSPAECADRIKRALDAIDRLEAAAREMQSDLDAFRADQFAQHVDASDKEWTIEEILAREG